MPTNSKLPAPSSQLVQTEIGSPPGPSTPPGSRGLPEDLLSQASRRLGIACLVIAGLWVANFVLAHVLQPAPVKMPDTAILRLFDLLGAANIAASLGLFWYSRRAERNPCFLLNLGLAYELLIALSIGILDWAYNHPMGVSWIAIVILLFSAIIPSPPRKTLVTALLAASMDPVSALIWKAAGQDLPGIDYVFFNAFPNYLCALVAPLISHIITGLGREVRRAREMGSYVLGERIGAGGMGEVWQATHRFLARPAAIKLIKPEVLEAMTKARRAPAGPGDLPAAAGL
jgi:serine/threonine-protein kinase